MINKYVAMGLGALIALAPVAALAQEQVAQAATDTTAPAPSMAAPTTGHMGSHRGHVRRKGNTAGHRARASAHHVRNKMMAPAAPAEAPK
jgi:hypothetical protein